MSIWLCGKCSSFVRCPVGDICPICGSHCERIQVVHHVSEEDAKFQDFVRLLVLVAQKEGYPRNEDEMKYILERAVDKSSHDIEYARLDSSKVDSADDIVFIVAVRMDWEERQIKFSVVENRLVVLLIPKGENND